MPRSQIRASRQRRIIAPFGYRSFGTVGMIVKGVGGANGQFCPWMDLSIQENLGPLETRHERTIRMKKPSSRIREEIAKLQEQLRQAETREAERIGRIALKAGLGEVEIDETDLQAAFEKLAARFRDNGPTTASRNKATPPLGASAAESRTDGA